MLCKKVINKELLSYYVNIDNDMNHNDSWDGKSKAICQLIFYHFNGLDFDRRYFWAWTDFQSYLDFMLAVFFVGAIITFFMLPYHWFMETIGFLATFIEAMLGKPISMDKIH